MTVTVEEEVEVSFPFNYKELAMDVIKAALDFESFPFEAEIALFLVSPEEIRNLNRDYRQIDRTTDVLSFPMISYETAGDYSGISQGEDNFNPDTGEVLLGDIVLCVDKVKEQAKAYGHSEQREYAFLILHSMLHLLGYDHMAEDEAAQMEKKQQNILSLLDITK